jgi:hypothetical protein
LRQAWRRRAGRTLTVEGYPETGGIRAAVATTAEDLYQRLGVDQRPLLRDLLLRLVVLVPDGEPSRSPVPRRQVAPGAQVDAMLERLIDGRVALWDGRTGELVYALPVAPPGTATFPGFLADGHTVQVVSTDGVVQAWDSDPKSWLAAACRIAGRELTRAEWAETVGGRPYRPGCA